LKGCVAFVDVFASRLSTVEKGVFGLIWQKASTFVDCPGRNKKLSFFYILHIRGYGTPTKSSFVDAFGF
tara:strand:- start:452 stop:658 length:207 start_codon:yes stop_codon:yes gene_type:complete